MNKFYINNSIILWIASGGFTCLDTKKSFTKSQITIENLY